MRDLKFLFILALVATIIGCNNNPDRPEPILSQEQVEASKRQVNTNTVITGNVQHYYCPNGCEGSGGDAQGTCPVCNTTYVHNAAYHNQPQSTTAGVQGINSGDQTITPTSNTNAEIIPPAATNAAGVYHYTCPNGCEGGAGSRGPCPKCGGDLTHNQAYHN